MLAFSGLQSLELRSMTGDNWKKEGLKIDVDDNITAIQASKNGTYLLLNISMTKPRIDLISFDETETWGKTL